MKNSAFILVLVLAISLAFGACGSALAEGFDEKELKQKAEDVVRLIHDKDYEGMRALCTEEVKTYLTDEAMKAQESYIEQKGTFVSVDKTAVTATKSEKDGSDLALVILIAKCEDGTLQYKVSFDQEMLVAGLWVS